MAHGLKQARHNLIAGSAREAEGRLLSSFDNYAHWKYSRVSRLKIHASLVVPLWSRR